ncbi:hypothetical protein [Sphingomonas sp. Leaf343]|uniref:hypothetical protein n=1 Tax=Sphingomonas sp. Leaf343 TaxID=1736345 RepID=UPI0006F9CB7D|nr:hypothetical protein [Sphingomonas sp. Leaf343]KQR87395.1 hypothetical protein ASG07_00175 [Sphingomonas sp. Leaf343]
MATSHSSDPPAPPASRLLGTVFVGAGCLAAMPAAARDYPTRDVAGWTVAASKDGKGCFLTRKYDRAGATTLLLGIDTDGTNHLTVLNDNWSIKAKDRLKLTFRLSSGAYPGHFAVGLIADGQRGFVTSFEPQFPTYFARSAMLAIARGDTPVERLDLTGSGAAVIELRRCVEFVRVNPGPKAVDTVRPADIPEDPFAPAPKRTSRK